MPKKLLVIVDVINGFITEGALADPKIAQIIPPVITALEAALANQDKIVALADAHSEDAAEFQSFPPHCLKGTTESALVAELLPYQTQLTLIEKNSTNGFFAPGFSDLLTETYQEIVLVGCCTDICVLQLALTLKTHFNQTNQKVPISVIKPATYTFDLAHHSAEPYHIMALNLMQQAGIIIKESYHE